MAAETGMKHIALFLPDLNGGGAERVMLTLAKGFVGHGHRVDLVLARASSGVSIVHLTQLLRFLRIVL